jgi:hypothetical protein
MKSHKVGPCAARRWPWVAVVAVVLVVAGGCNRPPGLAPSALGLFVPSQQPGDVLSLGHQLGVQVEGITAYTAGTSWSTIGSYRPPPTSLRLYLSVSMSPDNGSPAQTPGNLGVYKQLAQNLVNAGQTYAILRVGWEWSTTFFSWGYQNTTPGQYVTAFDDIVTTMRSVPGEHFLFDWCTAAGAAPTNGSFDQWYPGDAYVDYVGTDQYDNPTVSWDQGLNAVGGLGYVATFAKAHGKYVSIPEWGLSGGDDPAFIDNVHSFIANVSNSVAYSSYFSANGRIDSDITHFPNAMAEFTKDFGGFGL